MTDLKTGDKSIEGSLQSDNQFDQKVHRSPYRQAVHRAHEDQGRVQLHCITKHTNTNRQTVQPDD